MNDYINITKMNNNEKIQAFLGRFKSDEAEDNVFTPENNLKGLKIAKTTQPDERMSYSDTFKHINNEINKSK